MSEEPIRTATGFRHIALDEVGSTNTFLIERARAGEPGNLWVTAGRQLAGRGRRGRQWLSEAGNLYASLLLVDDFAAGRIATLPLVAALGVHGALRPFFSANPQALAIKWPNDILVDRQKIGGILLESERLKDGRLAVVIGCGVNCSHHPEGASYPTTDLAACGIDVAPLDVFGLLAAAMAGTLAVWDHGAGFGTIRRDWLLRADGVGGPVSVKGPDSELSGLFEDIDHDGYLLLKTKNGERHRISAGDLFFGETTGQRT